MVCQGIPMLGVSDRTLAMSILFDQYPGNDNAAALQALADSPKTLGLSYPCNAGWLRS